MINFKKVFDCLPDMYVVILPNEEFTVLGATDSYLKSVALERKGFIGKPLFAPFLKKDFDSETKKLKDSLDRVVLTKKQDSPPLLRYDIEGTIRYWTSKNIPILEDGEIEYIIHAPLEVTNLIGLGVKLQ